MARLGSRVQRIFGCFSVETRALVSSQVDRMTESWLILLAAIQRWRLAFDPVRSKRSVRSDAITPGK